MAARATRPEPATAPPLTRLRHWCAGLLAVLLVATTAVPAEDTAQRLEIIPLQHRLFDEIRPLIEPLVEAGGTLTGSGNQLILRASPANIADIRAALAALDRRAQRLRVTVSQARVADSAYDSYGIDASTGGRNARLDIGHPPGGPGPTLDARIARTHGRDEGTQVQSVLTVDGGSAWIEVVDARPQPTLSQQWTPYGPVVQQGLEWQDARSGFYVTPRLRGDEVQVEVSAQQQRFAQDNAGSIAAAAVDTVVSGRLGEWLPLGGTAEVTAGGQGEIIAHTRRREHAHTGYWLRVDLAP